MHDLRRRTSVITLVAVASILGLAGCSKASSSSETGGAQTIHAVGFGKMPASILADFKKKTGITVNWDFVDTATFPQVLQSRVAAKSDIDIVNLRGGAEFNKYAKAKTFVPLTGDSFLANVTAGGLAPGKYNGTQYGYSASSYVIGIFYNKGLFQKAGVQIPTTWDQFTAAADRLSAAGIAPLVGAQGDGWTNQYYYHTAIAQYAADHPSFMADLQSGKAKWSQNDLFTKQIDRFQGLVSKKYFLNGTQSFKYADALAAFNSGKAAMWAMGDWALADLKPQGFAPGAFAVPFSDAAPASSLSDNMFAATSWSKKQSEAKQFLAFLTQKDQAKAYSVELNKASAIKDVTATISPYQSDWDKLLPNAVPFPSNLGPSVNGSGPDLLGNIFAGKSSPSEAVSGFQKLQDSDNVSGY